MMARTGKGVCALALVGQAEKGAGRWKGGALWGMLKPDAGGQQAA